jgi:hypothetical protein
VRIAAQAAKARMVIEYDRGACVPVFVERAVHFLPSFRLVIGYVSAVMRKYRA